MGSPVNDHASIVNCHIMSRRSAGVRDSQYKRSAFSASPKLRKTLASMFWREFIARYSNRALS